MTKTPMFKISLVTVALVAMAGGGYAGLAVWGEKGATETQESEPVWDESTSGESSPDELEAYGIDISDWKLYQSSTMGFSIWYPSSWEVTPELPEFNGRRVDFKPANYDVSVAVIRGARQYSEEKESYLTFEEVVEAERTRSQNLSSMDQVEEDMVLGGSPAILISYTQYWGRGKQDVRTTYIYEKEHNTWIYFTIYNYDEGQKNTYFPIFATMVSSFRFEVEGAG